MRKMETTEKNEKFNRFRVDYIKINLSGETA